LYNVYINVNNIYKYNGYFSLGLYFFANCNISFACSFAVSVNFLPVFILLNSSTCSLFLSSINSVYVFFLLSFFFFIVFFLCHFYHFICVFFCSFCLLCTCNHSS